MRPTPPPARGGADPSNTRQVRKQTRVDERVSIDTYWLTSPTGQEGPAASVFWGDDEIMRIDILERRPHVHYRLYESLGVPGRQSVELQPVSAGDPLAQLRWQLSRNIPYALHLDRRRAVQRHVLSQPAVDAAVDTAVAHLALLLDERAGNRDV